MFDEICSIYSDALDNVGRYVDQDTGECIQQMSIREFCLTDRWKPYVEHLRQLRLQYGSRAKKMDEYVETKKKLPGATLSGLFELRDDECVRKDGSKFIAPVSRRETHLKKHTGWLAIDIDLADNEQVANLGNISMWARFRPEIALLMRSCSGTGYFGLVRLAYPDRHKEQFKALLKDYAALGIMLDKQCGNIGRVRFASWDEPENIYINERAVEYKGLEVDVPQLMPMAASYTPNFHRAAPLASSGVGYGRDGWKNDTPEIVYLKVQRLVSKIEARGIDIMGSYEGWVKCGISLYHVDPVAGLDMWRRISRFRPADSKAHRESEYRCMWPKFANYPKVSGNTFIKYCHESKIFLTHDELCEIYKRGM